jgi:hypothetical protein
MTRLRLLKKRLLILPLLLGLVQPSAWAQLDAATTGLPDFGRLLHLFGPHTNFSTKAELRVLDANQKERIFTPLELARADSRFRVQIDTTQIRNRALPTNSAAGMKQLGLDRVINLTRPDRQLNYAIFPTLRAYIRTPFATNAAAAARIAPRVERSLLGREKLDGRDCAKLKVILTEPRGQRSEFTVWEAASLRAFPVQIATRDGADTVVLRFRQIKLARPDAKDFEPPANYRSFTDVRAFMTSVLERRAQTAPKTRNR